MYFNHRLQLRAISKANYKKHSGFPEYINNKENTISILFIDVICYYYTFKLCP